MSKTAWAPIARIVLVGFREHGESHRRVHLLQSQPYSSHKPPRRNTPRGDGEEIGDIVEQLLQVFRSESGLGKSNNNFRDIRRMEVMGDYSLSGFQ